MSQTEGQTAAIQMPVESSPERYVWDSAGHAVRSIVERPAAERLREAAARGEGGVLLGEFAIGPGRTITIRDIEPVTWSLGMAEAQRRLFEQAVARLKAAGQGRRAVGYFRCQAGEELFLTAGDLVLMKSFFPEPTSLFLLLRPAAEGELASRYFYWNGGLLKPGWTEAGSPFGRPLAAGEEPPAPPEDFQPPSPMLPMAEPAAAPPRGRTRAAVVALVLACAGATAAMQYVPALKQLRVWPAAPAVRPAVSAGLSLEVERKLQDLMITWNREAPVIASARRAVLFIQDGPTPHSYDIDLGQLKTGSVFYTPLSGDVQFRLEVFGSGDIPAVASVRVLSAAVPAPVPLPEPAVPVLVPPKPAPRIEPRGEAARTEPVRRGEDNPLPRTVYFAYPRAAEVKPAPPMETPPMLAGSKPAATGPAAVMPAGVRVAVPQPPPATRPPAPVYQPPPRVSAYVAPRIIRQVYPSVPSSVRSMIAGDASVEVKVSIDERGKVAQAVVVGRKGASNSYLAESAASSARLWRFEPARDGGRPVPSEMLLNFRFLR